ncbi:MAG: SLBB domain-containing protein [candidate division KSB1 bacterium]|nr:SLBB domain-containing protein [candidate division KSB1 bacterium]
MGNVRRAVIGAAVCVILATQGAAQQASSQQAPGPQGYQQAARYYLGSIGPGGPDQLLMHVNVWGFVQKPGQYLVPANTNLVSLISFAGGPLEDASLRRIQLIRASADDGQVPVLNVDVEAYLKRGDPSLLPILRPGDTVIVRASKVYGFRKALDYVWRVAVIVQAYALFTYYLRHS